MVQGFDHREQFHAIGHTEIHRQLHARGFLPPVAGDRSQARLVSPPLRVIVRFGEGEFIHETPPPLHDLAQASTAVTADLASIERLAAALAQRKTLEELAVAAECRTLIEGVTVYPIESREEDKLKINGRLATLIASETLFPQRAVLCW